MDPSAKSFGAPDESRPFERGHVEVVALEGRAVSRMTFEPGWRWSDHVQMLDWGGEDYAPIAAPMRT